MKFRSLGLIFLAYFFLQSSVFAAQSNDVELKDLIVTVVQRGEVKGYYHVHVILRAKDDDAALIVRSHKPHLQDALSSYLYGLFAVLWSPSRMIEVEQLKKLLLDEIRVLFGSDLNEGMSIDYLGLTFQV